MSQYIYYEIRGLQESRQQYQSFFINMIRFSVIAFAMILMLFLFLSYYIPLSITRPIRRLTQVTDQVAKGDLTVRSDVTGGVEARVLSDSLNTMIDKINELLEQVKAKGVNIAHVTLHVGLGTFRPVKEENVLEHHMHSEYYQVTEEAANTINETKRKGGRVICVGTTSCRTVESAADEQGMVQPGCDNTEIFIYPGYRFKVLDALITNFHLPESTLVMLVSALAGREHILHAYEEAIREKYRFFSFGDAMFIADLKGEK